jgi:hypothetical protein
MNEEQRAGAFDRYGKLRNWTYRREDGMLIDLCSALREALEKNPSLRLGQFLVNLFPDYEGEDFSNRLFNVFDEEFLQRITEKS